MNTRITSKSKDTNRTDKKKPPTSTLMQQNTVDLLIHDASVSCLGRLSGENLKSANYCPFGFCPIKSNFVPSYAGGLLNIQLGGYFKGNGVRAYNPTLMRFIQPDVLSPFGRGGLNTYAYCAGDPINRIDPSGRAYTWSGLLKLVHLRKKTGITRQWKAIEKRIQSDVSPREFKKTIAEHHKLRTVSSSDDTLYEFTVTDNTIKEKNHGRPYPKMIVPLDLDDEVGTQKLIKEEAAYDPNSAIAKLSWEATTKNIRQNEISRYELERELSALKSTYRKDRERHLNMQLFKFKREHR